MVTKNDGDVTMNMTDIFRTKSDIGSSTVYNLRTGEVRVVPWGTLDWLGAAVGGLVSSVVLTGGAYLVYSFLRLKGFVG